jgi:hypothetical protein
VPLDPALSGKCRRHRMKLEVRLALRPRPGMAGMQMRLVFEPEFRIGESPGELRENALSDRSERHLVTHAHYSHFLCHGRPSSACGIGFRPP